MNDLISRQAAIDAADEIIARDESGNNDVVKAMTAWKEYIKALPSAQIELPKQFMSDDCISRSELYKTVCEAEKLARERVLDTPSDSPFPNKLNPAYTRYSAQLNERTQFKYMIADARSVQPESQWIPCSERLPEIDKEVLVTDGEICWVCSLFESPDIEDGFHQWEDNYGHWHEFDTWIAWMPLPQPWKGEE